MPHNSRLYRQQVETAGASVKEKLSIEEGVKRIQQFARMKVERKGKGTRPRKGFDQTVEIVMHLGIDPKQADQMIRGSISLPHGIGKKKTVIVFCDDDVAAKAKAAGAIEAGGDELINKVQGGWLDFDVAIAHPKLMGKVGKLGRVLGPAGKMPSPKSGTVTPDIEQAVKDYAAGKIEFRNDTGGNVHAAVGKASFETKALVENVEFLVNHVRRMRPATAKGQFFKTVALSATMTPGVRLNVE